MKFLRIIAAWLVLFVSASACAIDRYTHASTFTNASPWSAWAYQASGDTPNGGWLATPGATTNVIYMTVPIGTNLPAGNYAVSIRTVDYDYYWATHFSAGGGTSTNYTSDRDADSRWSSFSRFTASSSFTNITITWSNEVAVAGLKTAFEGVMITSETNAVMLSTSRFVPFTVPDPSSYDSTQEGRNLIRNGSFEAGIGRGFGFYAISRTRGLNESWDNTVAWDGRSSLRVPLTNGELNQILTKAIVAPSNRVYVASFRAKSTGTNQAVIRIANTMTAPSGYTSTLSTQRSVSVGTNWTLVSITNRLFAYPYSDHNLLFQMTGTGWTTNWFDGFALRDAQDTNYTAEATLELAIFPNRVGHIYYSDSAVNVPIGLANSTTNAIAGSVTVKAWDYLNRPVLDTNASYSLGSLATNTVTVAFPTGLQGHFRIVAFDESYGGEPDEANISVLPRPRGIAQANAKFGGHIIDAPYTDQILTNIGMQHVRRLSPGAYFRWSIAEPTEGNFVWYDSAINQANGYGLRTLANITQDTPTFAQRTFFRVNNLTGAFTDAELVSTATATGQVDQIMVSTNFTGNALFLTNRFGSFANGASVTGLTSGAIGTIATINSNANAQTDIVSLRKWSNFVSNLVTHYVTNVFDWEICNEPNQGSQYIVGDAGIYSEVLRTTAPLIKTIQTNASLTVLGGALATNWIGSVLSNMNSIGYLGYFSNASVHIYPGNDSSGPSISNIMAAYSMPWMNSESGATDWGAFSSWGSAARREGTPVEPYNDADRYYLGTGYRGALVVCNHLESLGDGAFRVYTYDQRSYPPSEFENRYSGIEYDDTLKPVTVALACAAGLIDGATSAGRAHASTNIYANAWNMAGTNTVVTIHSKTQTNTWTVTLPGGFPSYVRRDWYGNPVGTNEASFVVGRYPTYLTLTNAAAGVATNFAASTVALATDTFAPHVMVNMWPAIAARTNAQTIPLQWFAIDDRVKPETGPLANALLYRIKVHPVDLDWRDWSPSTTLDVAGYGANRYTLYVEAKDLVGNTTNTSQVFWIGSVRPLPGTATATTVNVGNLIAP